MTFFSLIKLLLRIHTALEALNEKLNLLLGHHVLTNSTPQEKWLDNQEVMQLLHVGDRTLLRLRSSGKLPYTCINRKFYYKQTDIDMLMKSGYTGKAA